MVTAVAASSGRYATCGPWQWPKDLRVCGHESHTGKAVRRILILAKNSRLLRHSGGRSLRPGLRLVQELPSLGHRRSTSRFKFVDSDRARGQLGTLFYSRLVPVSLFFIQHEAPILGAGPGPLPGLMRSFHFF